MGATAPRGGKGGEARVKTAEGHSGRGDVGGGRHRGLHRGTIGMAQPPKLPFLVRKVTQVWLRCSPEKLLGLTSGNRVSRQTHP